MKNTMKRILALSLAAMTSMAFADSNNRTYMAARPQLSNMALTHGTFFSCANQDNPGFGGALQATAFYEQSVDQDKLGNYFTFTKNNKIKVQGGANRNVSAADADALPGNFALNPAYNGEITLKPRRTSYGVHLNYQQALSMLCEKLYLSVNAPVVTVENDLRMKEDVTANPGAGAYTFADVMRGGRLTSDFSESFKFAKIDGKHRVTGLADIEVGVGYKFLQTDRFRLQGGIDLTIPTSAAPTAERMFEAVLGNAGHWALGANLGGRVGVWQNQENEDNRFSLAVTADVKYLFEGNEMRTLGIKDKAGAQFARMRQENPNRAGFVLANSLPGVNAMTRQMKVTPGLQAEGMLWGDYTWNAWKFGAGYNIFGRAEEKSSLKNKFDAQGNYGLSAELLQVGPQAGGVAGANYTVSTAISGIPNGQRVQTVDGVAVDGGAALKVFANNAAGNSKEILQNSYFVLPAQISAGPALGVAHAARANTEVGAIQGAVDSSSTIKQHGHGGAATAVATDGQFLTDASLDMLKTKSAISHKLAGQISYALNTDSPSYLGLGGGYEFAGSNDLTTNWSLWAKLGVSF